MTHGRDREYSGMDVLAISVLLASLLVVLVGIGVECVHHNATAKRQQRALIGVLVEQAAASRPATATATAPATRAFIPLPVAKVDVPDVYRSAVERIWFQESKCGRDPRWRITGEAGERGQFRMTPIFLRDCKLYLHLDVDPMAAPEKLKPAVYAWLKLRAPQVGATEVTEMMDLYRRGPTGYRKARQ